MEPIKNELILCTQSHNDTIDFRTFGDTIINECAIDFQYFFNPNYPSYFYQMYIKKNDNSFQEIPVEADNHRIPTGLINGQVPEEQKELYKRFFLIFNRCEDNKLVFAQNVTLKIELDRKNYNGVSTANKVYLKIYYMVEDGNLNNGNINVSFVSDYYMNEEKIRYNVYGFLIFFCIFMAFVVAARMYVWCILNPENLTNRRGNEQGSYILYFLINIIFTVFKYTGIIFFFFSWGITAFWYIFFKTQYRPFVFFPSFYLRYEFKASCLYYYFNCIWGTACNMYGYYIMYRIYNQVNVDIFFIDWEHEKNKKEETFNDEITFSKPYKCPWRTIHVVNQYNLLQKSRTISIPFCFLCLLFLYYSKYTNWYRYAQLAPNISWVERSPENILLRHFVGTSILFIVGLAQYILVRVVQLWIPTKKTEFLDLCSVANMSVLILSDSLRGYYLHGQSPLGMADTTLYQLAQFLEEESKGKIKGRGITDNKNDNLQTYEIYLSFPMRRIYDSFYFTPTTNEIIHGNSKDANFNQAKFRNVFRFIPYGLETGNIYQLNKFMNTHLKTKIEQATMQSHILIKEKTKCERLFDFPPSIDLTSKDVKELVFYKDEGGNFEDVLFTGMELEWLIFVIYVWEMWCIALQRYNHSFPISIFMTYVMERIFFKVRVFFGEKNVARKAIVDNRFL